MTDQMEKNKQDGKIFLFVFFFSSSNVGIFKVFRSLTSGGGFFHWFLFGFFS